MLDIPIISYHQWQSAPEDFAEAIGRSFRETGFAIISDHPIRPDDIAACYEVSRGFFALEDKVKKQYSDAKNGFQRGYAPFAIEHAKGRSEADLKEFWHVGRDRLMPTPSVSEMPEFDRVTRNLFAEMDRLGQELMKSICLHLKQPANQLDQSLDRGNSILRLLHYPPLTGAEAKGAVRAGAHEDINLITLLLGAEEAGLELLHRSGQWITINPPEGAVVVNCGDMLSRWSAGVLPSTTHRVVNPDGAAAARSRYSMPFFLHPNSDFMISPLKSCIDEGGVAELDIIADDFLKERLREIGLRQT